MIFNIITEGFAVENAKPFFIHKGIVNCDFIGGGGLIWGRKLRGNCFPIEDKRN